MPRIPGAQLNVTPIFDNITVAQNSTIYSIEQDVRGLEGYLAAFVRVQGSGQISIYYEVSLDNLNWSQVPSLSTLLSNHGSGSGPASDGRTYLYFNPPIAAWLRFKITETNVGSAGLTLIMGGL